MRATRLHLFMSQMWIIAAVPIVIVTFIILPTYAVEGDYVGIGNDALNACTSDAVLDIFRFIPALHVIFFAYQGEREMMNQRSRVYKARGRADSLLTLADILTSPYMVSQFKSFLQKVSAVRYL
eukprot:GFYU01045171.1.p1 GENE.GFYU01045171.1~~GFYU01045171.1.p1  ORF type:complete len:124 (+),score=26.79 GFYU01045171.1:54-425(+)